ncbi:hypothetical protein BCCH1_01020 [Burkholderia contaminans]|uniref:Uncharacterized protein n=1 Tax=Burkholderia contaminans TaxID=488447 RepID=A0A286P4K5_9BURK|nr:hypothetical protein BCCH1_01020 [Burkholderia contaminans]GLZ71347.1 hypothetical protein Bcon01_43920 [Burkholderia contaminans]
MAADYCDAIAALFRLLKHARDTRPERQTSLLEESVECFYPFRLDAPEQII